MALSLAHRRSLANVSSFLLFPGTGWGTRDGETALVVRRAGPQTGKAWGSP